MYFNKKRWKEYKERMKLNCCILCQPRLLSEFFYITHTEEEIYDIITEPSDFDTVREKLEESGLEFLEASVQMVPTTTVSLDEKGVEKMERLLERLDELDDVSNVYHNWEE